MSLGVNHWPCVKPECSQHIVLLHGWGMSSAIWQPLITPLQALASVTTIDLPGFGGSGQQSLTLPALLDQLAKALPQQAVLVGFSLGGMLALQLAARCPERVAGVVTLASNGCYIASDDWPHAMAPEVFEAFYQGIAAAPAVTLKRFLGLQCYGAVAEKALLKELRALVDVKAFTTETLLQGLDWLRAIDNRVLLASLKQPRLHLLAENDQLVPVAAADSLRALGEPVEVVAQAGHAFLLSDSQRVVQRLQRFLAELPQHDAQPASQLQKQRVAASFSRAAASYDAVADLQRAVGDSLLSRIPAGLHATVVDLGCGTGYFQRPLAAMTHCETLLGVDIAEGMLHYARQHHHADNSCWLAGDAEQLPLASQSVDLIFSSLAIQWCENLPALFDEVERVLRPGGRFVFATLGPETLTELRQAWQQVDSHVHVNRFLPRSALLQAAPNLVLSEQVITLQYQKLNELTRELKGLGAHNVNAGRPTGLTGKQRIVALKQAYEHFRNDDGQLPATYQVWFGEYCKQEQR